VSEVDDSPPNGFADVGIQVSRALEPDPVAIAPEAEDDVLQQIHAVVDRAEALRQAAMRPPPDPRQQALESLVAGVEIAVDAEPDQG
jgi:hypothetical protein